MEVIGKINSLEEQLEKERQRQRAFRQDKYKK